MKRIGTGLSKIQKIEKARQRSFASHNRRRRGPIKPKRQCLKHPWWDVEEGKPCPNCGWTWSSKVKKENKRQQYPKGVVYV
jgi:hypothetical protein